MDVAFVAPFGFAPKSTTLRRVMPMARALVARGLGVRVVVPPYDDPRSFGRRWDDHGVQVVCLERPPLYGVRGVGAARGGMASFGRDRGRRAGGQWRASSVPVLGQSVGDVAGRESAATATSPPLRSDVTPGVHRQIHVGSAPRTPKNPDPFQGSAATHEIVWQWRGIN